MMIKTLIQNIKLKILPYLMTADWLLFVRNFIRTRPFLKKKLQEFLHSVGSAYNDDFKIININGTRIHFHMPATYLHRGIGRISRDKLYSLLARADKIPATKQVYFYAGLAVAPQTLKQPAVMLVHDLVPLDMEDKFDDTLVQRYQTHFRNIASCAAHIVTISQSSKDSIIKHYGIAPDKISVAFAPINPLIDDNQPLMPQTKPYFITLGGVDVNKNIETIFNLWRDNPDIANAYDLKIIGENKVLENSDAPFGVSFLGQVPDKDLPAIVKGAQALLFPSLGEGFGLPPFEVSFLGVPSICAARPAMSELLDGTALFVEPYDSAGWKAALHKIAQDRVLAKQLADKTKENALTHFTSAKYADNILTALEKAAAPF